jgi:predicted amidohydrolase YtcJ
LIADRARGLSFVDAPKSIEWGMRADLAVLSGTLTQLSPDEIAQMSLDELFLFGESVYRRESDERPL